MQRALLYLILFMSLSGRAQLDQSIYRSYSLAQVDSISKSTQDPEVLAAAHYHKARKTFLISNLECIEAFRRAFPIIKALGKDSIYASARLFYTLPLINETMYTEAYQVIQEVKTYNETKGNRFFLASIHSCEGYLKSELGDYAGAFDSYHKARDIYQSDIPQNTDYGINDNNNRLGILYSEIGMHEKAIEYYKKVRSHSKAANVTYFYRAATNNLAESLSSLGRGEEAIPLIEEVIELRKKNPTLNNRRRIYLDKSELSEIEGKLNEAISFQDSAMIYSIQLENTSALIDNYISLARLNKLNENSQNERDLLLKGESIAKAKGAKTRLLKIYRSLAENFYHDNQQTTAAEYYNEYLNISDELNRVEAIAQLEREIAQREISSYDNKLKEVSQQAAGKEVQLEKQKLRNRWLLLFVLMSVLMLITLYKTLFERKKNQKKLTTQNSIIAESLADKEILLKEIHHRVKNNLQIVSSMLNLNLRYVEDAVAKEILLESRNRVKSMALIHQKLYQEEHLKGVKLRTYIESLANNLLHSYKKTGASIEVAYDIEDMVLDVDTLIPFGLIVNELISNSLKHAFNESPSGRIKIKVSEKDDVLNLNIKDDGSGMYKNAKVTGKQSFGMALIEYLGEKLKAKIDFVNHNGTEVNIDIHQYSIYKKL